MKKLILPFLILCVFAPRLVAMGKDQAFPDRVSQITKLLKQLTPEEQKLLQTASSGVGNFSNRGTFAKIFTKSSDFFNFMLNRGEKLISKRFLIAMLLVLGPSAFVYFRFIDPTLAQALIKFLTRITIRGAGKLGAPIMEGIAEETTSMFWSNKMAALKFAGTFAVWSTVQATIAKLALEVGDKVITKVLPMLFGF